MPQVLLLTLARADVAANDGAARARRVGVTWRGGTLTRIHDRDCACFLRIASDLFVNSIRKIVLMRPFSTLIACTLPIYIQVSFIVIYPKIGSWGLR